MCLVATFFSLAHAASFAEARNISEIYFGAHAQDSPAFPDCKKEFFNAVQETLSLGTKHPLSIFTPFIHLTKKEIILLGKQLKVPMELTLSCYDPQEGTPCGTCPACMLRNEKRQALQGKSLEECVRYLSHE